MKISKFVQIVKRRGRGIVIHLEGGGIVLSTGTAIYKTPGLPDMHGEEQIRTVLDIEPKQMEKIYISEDYAQDISDIYGCDLSDGYDGTIGAKKLQTSVFVGGRFAQALEADDGELIFYDDALFEPLKDVEKESEYITLAVRKTPKGQRYVIFMDGFEVLAAVMPIDVVNEDYLKELKKFEEKVYRQLMRNKARKKEKEEAEKQGEFDPETGEIYEQQTIEGTEDEES